jgi:hypothetical protein
MKATTIKVEGDLLKEMEAACPPSQCISAFVREVLRNELKRRRVAEAAVKYEQFVASHPEEREWLDEWEKADLIHPPQRKSKKS